MSITPNRSSANLSLPDPTPNHSTVQSKSLYLAIIVVGLTFGLGLPAEFMLVELIVNDPSELAFERGGWVAIVILVIPLLVGLCVCLSEFRGEAAQREKWARIRRNYNKKSDDPER